MDYTDQFKAVVLGALLHDIGKFWQRADREINYQNSNSITSETRNNISSICPKWQNDYTHKHALWTNEFFVKYGNMIIKQADIRDYDSLGYDNPANLASYHHNPSTELQLIIQMADRLSAGMDRTKGYDIEDELTGLTFRKARLKPVFESISLSKENELKDQYRYEIKSLQFSDDIFPRKKENLYPESGVDLNNEYNMLWVQFNSDLKKLRYFNFYQYIGALLSLLENYTWCVPSSTHDLPDISLYDHLKTTTAIASCLWYYHKDNLEKAAIKNKDTEKFIFMGADLSGIQNYIFDLVHTGIKSLSKILRARSFYLTYLPKMIVTKILTSINLTPANIIMDSGGRIFLLLPNIPEVIAQIKDEEKRIKRWCLDEFNGELTVNFDYSVLLSGEDFCSDGFQNKLNELNYNLELQKVKKLNFISENDFISNPMVLDKEYNQIVNNNGAVCSITGKKPVDNKASEMVNRDISKEAYLQSMVGRILTKSTVFYISAEKPEDEYKPHFKFFDDSDPLYLYLSDRQKKALAKQNIIDIEQIKRPTNQEQWIKFTHLANHVPRFKDQIECSAYNEYNKEYFDIDIEWDNEPAKPGDIKTFNLLAVPINKIFPKAEEEKKTGVNMLGIIKADVDNLGLIFSNGLKEGRMSVSRYSTLSRSFNMFFSGYLNQLLSDEFQNIYTVYSGGDDLFMIGFWEDIIKFSQKLNILFREFTCNNPDIHLSAGITLMKSRQPVKKAAELAEEQLDSAKHTDINKNKLSIFGTPVKWELLPCLNDWSDFFDTKLKLSTKDSSATGINSAFLYRLLKYRQTAMKYFNPDPERMDAEGLTYLSKLSYDIKRNIEKKNEAKTVINMDELKKLQQLTDINGSDPIIKYIHIPIYYALYKNRGGH